MNDQEKFEYCEETKNIKRYGDMMYLEMGKRLGRIRDERLFEPQHSSFSEYCWEIQMDETKASKLINTYNKLVKRLGIPEESLLKAGGWSNIYEVKNLINSKRDADKWLDIVANNSRPSIRKLIKEAKTGIDMARCEHRSTRDIHIRFCNICGDSWKIKHDNL